MKGKILVGMIMALVLVGGCASVQSWFCSNQATVQGLITGAQNTITTIQAEFGAFIPTEYQVVIDAATAVVSQGEAMLAKQFCPTDADVQTLQTTSSQMSVQLTKAGNATRAGLKK